MAYRTGFQIPMGVSPYRYLFNYVCQLPTCLKQLCHLHIKLLNSDLMQGREPALLKYKESENWRNRVEEKEPHKTPGSLCTTKMAEQGLFPDWAEGSGLSYSAESLSS